eukprot:8262756-Karenia_brevis.AAC.1
MRIPRKMQDSRIGIHSPSAVMSWHESVNGLHPKQLQIRRSYIWALNGKPHPWGEGQRWEVA